MDDALISADVYPDRRQSEGFFHVHSIAKGSKSEQSDLSRYQLIVSVNGTNPQSLEHLHELISGSQELSFIVREWSDTGKYLYEYLLVNYNPQEITFYERSK